MKNKAKSLAVVLSAAMILSTTATPLSDAKVKKPTVSPTKVSIEEGASKKVTVKNAKKAAYTIDKKGKAVVSLSKKSKKGVTIKGKKAGSAKITVKMTYGKKKTLKKTIKVTVTAKAAEEPAASAAASAAASIAPTASVAASATPAASAAASAAASTKPTASAAASTVPSPTATVAPTPTITPTPAQSKAPLPSGQPFEDIDESYSLMEVDLDTANNPSGGEINYDETTKTLSVVDTPLITIELPETAPEGSIVKVNIIGTLKGERGFRSYLIPGTDNAVSNIANCEEDGIEIGDFNWTYELVADSDAMYIQLKGITWQDPIDDLEIRKMTVAYKMAE